MKKELSYCCKAEKKVVNGKEGTSYFACTKCEKEFISETEINPETKEKGWIREPSGTGGWQDICPHSIIHEPSMGEGCCRSTCDGCCSEIGLYKKSKKKHVAN